MTDRELLEKAAKAADMWVDRFCLDEENYPIFHEVKGFYLAWGAAWWNPLTDDGDALRLAVKLNIPVIPYDDETSTGTTGVVATNWGSKEANTRRAIVRAAFKVAPMPYYRVRYHFLKACKALGLKKTIHKLRHGTATAILTGGGDLKDVQVALNHKSAQSAMRYSHFVQEIKVKALSYIGKRA